MSILDSKAPLHRYIVDEVSGDVPEGVSVGSTIIDFWRGKRGEWNVFNVHTGKYTAFWSGVHVAKITPAELAEMKGETTRC